MNRAKRITVFLLGVLFLSIFFAACDEPEPENTPQPAEAAPATYEAEETPTGPEAGLTAEIVSGDIAGAGKPFTFDATQSIAGTYAIEAYEWDMGDGTYMFGLAVQHAYDEPGEYTVTLTVIDEDDGRDSVSKVVEIISLEDLLTPTAVSQDPTLALIGTYWLMNNPIRGTIITLNFDEDDLSGSAGCNSYNAGYSVTDAEGPATNISVGVIGGTNQVCTQEIMAQERGFLDSLASAESYQIDDNRLTLITGSGTLTFRLAN